jgi:perosamine synthetase
MKQFIPVNEPVVSAEARKNVLRALDAGWLSSAGPDVEKFERNFARYIGAKHAITVNTGTAALHVALLAVGVGTGDEVIVPAFTMASTWLAVIYTGATPIFVDCEVDTYNINPKLIEILISKHTKVILPVHIYGHPVDMDAIMKIARRFHLVVIEDAAEAHGAEYNSQKCGSFGKLSCFSFYANKLVTCGEGGMVVTNSLLLAKKVRKYKDLYNSTKKRFIHEQVGFNYRMTNLQAAVGCGELKHIKEYIAKKQQMASLYNLLLADIPGIICPVVRPNVKSIFWMYAIRIQKKKFGLSKKELRQRLLEKGIDTRDFFYPPNQQPFLKGTGNADHKFPVAEQIAKEGCYLPSGLAITTVQIKKVAKEISRIYALHHS